MISNQFILPHFSTKTNCRAAIFYAKPALPTVYAEPYGRGRCGAFFLPASPFAPACGFP